MNIEINPEFRALIPPLSPEEYGQLEKNILADGCREPLVLFNGVLVDGHNRLKICTEHDLAYSVVEMDFTDSLAARLWMIRNQFGRRNLSNYQRASLALEMEPMLAEQAKMNQGTRTDILQKSAKCLTPMS
jgi:ParB-like chromosome segregation protein Spo0J